MKIRQGKKKKEKKNGRIVETRKKGRMEEFMTFIPFYTSWKVWQTDTHVTLSTFHNVCINITKLFHFSILMFFRFFHSSGFPSRPVSIIDHSSFLPFFRIFSLLSFHLSIFLGISAPESLKFDITWLKLWHKNGVLDNIFGCFGHLTSPKRSLTSPENSNALR